MWTWFDDADAELKAVEDRERAREEHELYVSENQEKTYELFCKELRAQVDEAKRRQFPTLTMNGQPFARSIQIPVTSATYAARPAVRHVEVSLERTAHVITAIGDIEAIRLNIDTCDEGHMCLKFGGKELSYRDAAVAILRPLLYPKLYPAYCAPRIS